MCDFGFTKIAEDSKQTSNSVALGNGARWAAPELMMAAHPYATRAIDIYAFAMTVLECLTLQPPFAEYSNDVPVVVGVMGHLHRPKRPAGRDADRWISDDLWRFLKDAWAHADKTRPKIEEVLRRLRILTDAYATAHAHEAIAA